MQSDCFAVGDLTFQTNGFLSFDSSEHQRSRSALSSPDSRNSNGIFFRLCIETLFYPDFYILHRDIADGVIEFRADPAGCAAFRINPGETDIFDISLIIMFRILISSPEEKYSADISHRDILEEKAFNGGSFIQFGKLTRCIDRKHIDSGICIADRQVAENAISDGRITFITDPDSACGRCENAVCDRDILTGKVGSCAGWIAFQCNTVIAGCKVTIGNSDFPAAVDIKDIGIRTAAAVMYMKISDGNEFASDEPYCISGRIMDLKITEDQIGASGGVNGDDPFFFGFQDLIFPD